MFFRGSRYEIVASAELATPDGRTIRYKRVRFIPETPGVLPYRTKAEERLEHIAFQAYGDAEQFWRICDANLALRPDELTEQPGTRLLLPVPLR
jgi:nucleoid-associated protein YgaU